MPRRYQILATDEVYHVFNRSIGKEQIFTHKYSLKRAFDLINYYRYAQRLRYSQFKLLSEEAKNNYISAVKKRSPLVDIYSFALMPNHYHLLVRQMHGNGIMQFIANFQNGFAKYFNLKEDRHGGVFESTFKAKRIETDEELLHLSRYIHLNPVTSFFISYKQLLTYPWTSFSDYKDKIDNSFVNTQEILNRYKTKENYFSFVKDQIDYQRKLNIIKHLTLD